MGSQNKTFEQYIKELEEIVTKLESGELSLDESLEAFQKGIEISRYCNKKLDEMEKKITILIEKDNGEIEEQEFMPANTLEG